MAEQNPYTPDEARFGDIYTSRFYQDRTAIQLPGDPETPEDFARAQNYLETITNHLIEFGPVWEKQPQEVAYELDYQNAWHKYQIDQERQAGEKGAAYRAINLQNLSALSKRRLLAFEAAGWEVTHDYRVVQHVDALIEQAALEQEQLEQLMTTSSLEHTIPPESPADASDDVPF